VLPASTGRAAVLREADDIADEVVPPDLPRDDRDQGRADAAADIRRWADHVERDVLRRMADETPPAETQAQPGGIQPCGHDDYHDGHEWADLPDVWCPGIGYDEPTAAVAQPDGDA